MSAGREVAGKKETDSGVESGVLVMTAVVVMATPHLSINREERQLRHQSDQGHWVHNSDTAVIVR